MDSKVCGKLLTTHRRGYGVDVEALRDRCSFRGAPEQAPRWDLVGTEGCGGGIRFLAPVLIVWGYVGIYIGGRSTSVDQQGTHEGGGRAPLPRGLLFLFLT